MALGWLWWRAWFSFGAVVAAAVGVAGVALGDIGLHFVWQAWHLATLTFTSCGRRGTYGTGLALAACLVPVWCHCRRGCLCGRRGTWRHRPALCVAGVALGNTGLHFVAGVALGDIDVHSAWQAWYLLTSNVIWCGGRGTFLQRLFFGGAGVALGDRKWLFAWQEWHSVISTLLCDIKCNPSLGCRCCSQLQFFLALLCNQFGC